MKNANNQKALEGVVVIDLTHVLSGPFCTMMLADQGARVIKVERPGAGDDSRAFGPFYDDGFSVYFEFVNRGKESIALNLKDSNDLALLRRMLQKADVVVENFRPGTMARLGLAPDRLVEENPRLIVCSISGFGQTGPMSQEPAYDTVVQALSGLMSVTGDPGGNPVRTGTSIGDLSAGLFAYAAIATALAARERTGVGTAIDISMLDGLFSLLEHGLMDALAKHIDPQRIGNRHPSIAPFDTFHCKDRLIVICCGNDHLFQQLCDALEVPETKKDPRFRTNDDRIKNQEALKQALEERLKTQEAAAWLKKLEGAGIPVGFVNTVEEARNMEQIRARNMVVEIQGRQVPGSPLKMSRYDSQCAASPPPALDAHGESLRKEFG